MTQFTLPTSRRITQEWGQDFNWLNGKHYPNGFYATIGWLGHNGIDYGCPEGDEVEAVCDGVIEYVGPGNNHPLLTGGGNALLLRNDELGIRFEYLHLSQQNVYTGQKVKRGQVIARSGNTGISSGSHLHLGAIPIKPNLNNGYRGRVDPTGWLYGPSNPDYAGISTQGTTITPLSEEDDVSAKDVWEYPLTIDGKEYPAHDVLRYSRANAIAAKEKADAAPGLAVQTLLATRIPAPDGSGKSYTIAEYITYGWMYSMKAKDTAAAIEPLDPAVLTAAIAKANATAVASQLEITVKEN